jgi:hypothetical protein
MVHDSKMTRISAIAIATVAWLTLCALTWRIDAAWTMNAMIVVWWANIFLLPVGFGLAGSWVLSCGEETVNNAPEPVGGLHWVWSVAAISCAIVSYVLSVAVLSRVSNVWSEGVRLGDPNVSLGRSAALAFALVASTAYLTALASSRTVLGMRYLGFLTRASMGCIRLSRALHRSTLPFAWGTHREPRSPQCGAAVARCL